MRKLSEGRTAEIYDQGQGKVVKLYRNGFAKDAIRYEYEVNQLLPMLGVPTPKAYEWIEYEQRTGLVFERIEGSALLHMLVQRSEELAHFTTTFAQLHYQVHRSELTNEIRGNSTLHDQKAVLTRHIREVEQLSPETKVEIIRFLESLPDGNCLCHGDYHPDNVMIGDKNWIVDWMTGVIGNPAADVARTVLLFRYGTLPNQANERVKDTLLKVREQMCEMYLERYLSYSGLEYHSIDEWILPVAAARLTEWIPEEEKALLLRLIEVRVNELACS